MNVETNINQNGMKTAEDSSCSKIIVSQTHKIISSSNSISSQSNKCFQSADKICDGQRNVSENKCSVAHMQSVTTAILKEVSHTDQMNLEKDTPTTMIIHDSCCTDTDCSKDIENTENRSNPAESYNTIYSTKTDQHLCKMEFDINAIQKLAPGDKYCCGSCSGSFSTICSLHEHLQADHESGGSYYYNHSFKKAFPKFDTCCRSTQTGENMLIVDIGELHNVSRMEKANVYSQVSEKENISKLLNASTINGTLETDVSKTILQIDQGIDRMNSWKDVKIENVASLQDLNFNSDGADDYFDDGDEAEESALVTRYLNETESLTDKDSLHNGSSGKSQSLVDCKQRKRKQSKPQTIKGEKTDTGTQEGEPTGRENTIKVPRSDLPSDEPLQDPIPDADCKCDICGAKFSFKRGLLRHEQMKHLSDMKHRCQYCDQSFMREYNLQKHIKCVHTIGRGQKYREKYRAKRKLEKEEKSNVVVNEIPVPSQPEPVEVEESAGAEENKTCEKKDDHLSPKAPHTCNICGYTMPRSKMEVHQRLHSGERPFICHVCGKGLISDNKLKRHLLIHSEIKKHTCDVCGAGFQMKYKLRMHQHIHTGKKPYLCSICGAEFNHSSNLATHTRCVHLQIKPFVCPTCGGTYAKRSQLDDHILSHSTEKQFTCRYCGKSFKYYKGMRRHEKNHIDVKHQGFPCDKCHLKFTREDNLERHISAYHPDTPFECKECNKTFKNEKILRHHQQSHMKSKQYECVLCGEQYKLVNQFYTHMLAAHGIDRDQAKLIQSGERQAQTVAMQTLGQNLSPQIDPNLPLRLEGDPTPATSKAATENINASLNVTQMVSGIMDENRAAITALTRVATENLHLHSEDVNDEEQLNVIVPPLNPMILLERSQGFSSLADTNSLNVADQNSGCQVSLAMLAPVSQTILQQTSHLVNNISQVSQHQTIHNQLEQTLRMSQEGRTSNFNSLQISLPLETRSISHGSLNSVYSIQDARMTLESLARQHETVSVPLTLMRLSENIMDPPTVERQNTEASEQTVPAGNMAYRIQNLYLPQP